MLCGSFLGLVEILYRGNGACKEKVENSVDIGREGLKLIRITGLS